MQPIRCMWLSQMLPVRRLLQPIVVGGQVKVTRAAGDGALQVIKAVPEVVSCSLAHRGLLVSSMKLPLVEFDVIQNWRCRDPRTGVDLAKQVAEYYIPGDFQHWEDNAAFNTAFERLLRDLRDADAKPPGAPS